MSRGKKKKKMKQNENSFKTGISGMQGGPYNAVRINPWASGMAPNEQLNMSQRGADSYVGSSLRSGGSSLVGTQLMNQPFNQGYISTQNNGNYGFPMERNPSVNQSFNQGYQSTSGSSYELITNSSGYNNCGRPSERKRPMNESFNQEHKRAKNSGYEFEPSSSKYNAYVPSMDGQPPSSQSFNQGYLSTNNTNASNLETTSRVFGFGRVNEGRNAVNQPANQDPNYNLRNPMNQGSTNDNIRSFNQNQGSTNDNIRSFNQNQGSINKMISPTNQPASQGPTSNMMRAMNEMVSLGPTSDMMLMMNQLISKGPTNDMVRAMNQLVNQVPISNVIRAMNQSVSQGASNSMNLPMNQSVSQGSSKNMSHPVNQSVHQGPSNNMKPVSQGTTNNMMRPMNQPVRQVPINNVVHPINQSVNKAPINSMTYPVNHASQGSINNVVYPMNQSVNQGSASNMMHPMNQQFSHGKNILKNSTVPELGMKMQAFNGLNGQSAFQRGTTFASNNSMPDSTPRIPSLMDTNFTIGSGLGPPQSQRVGGLWQNQYRLNDYRNYNPPRVSNRIQPKTPLARLQQKPVLSKVQQKNILSKLQQKSVMTKIQQKTVLAKLQQKSTQTKSHTQFHRKKGKKKKSKAHSEEKVNSKSSNKSEKTSAPKSNGPSQPDKKEGKKEKAKKEENKDDPMSKSALMKKKAAEKAARAIVYPGSAFHCVYCEFYKFRSCHKFKKHVLLHYHKEVAEAYCAKMTAREEYLKASAKLYQVRHRRKRLDSEGKVQNIKVDSVEQRLYERAIDYPKCCDRKFPDRKSYDVHMGSVEHFKVSYKKKLEMDLEQKAKGKNLEEEKMETEPSSKTEDDIESTAEKGAIERDLPEEIARVCALLKEARKNAEETPLNEDTIPIFDPSKAVGLEFIKEYLNFYCDVCDKRVPDLEHCHSVEHYENIINRLDKLKESGKEITSRGEEEVLKETAEGKPVFMDDAVKDDGGASPIAPNPCPMDTSDVGQRDEIDKLPSNDSQADSQCFSLDGEEFPDYERLVGEEFILEKTSDLDE